MPSREGHIEHQYTSAELKASMSSNGGASTCEPPMPRSNAWRNATLAANPTARNLGKEWLTQQMYHNMHEPLALLPAVSCDDDFFDIDVQTSNDGDPFTRSERAQFTWPGTVVEETANTRLFHTTTSNGIFVNSLQGHFSEANRYYR
ncbi:hypothetical protein H257_07713 [Aphanomyces astaci]|uniref:Uncharacterized protein n=1 Tax=Aphanomyces astaci TaxID=112090 RepID=W4GJ14_APHAT|nr:hypothetical protein H257_07713 [Aphanomyces astaci]ETV78923.1 hypothetical protein H257_07713 [Aphanomyces astaci]|eukprot:XP_009831642.1 hypothetical protein H257_07713 [Aphanomyces astaci]